MEQYVGVLALCIVPGILASLAHMFLARQTQQRFQIKNIYFYAAAFYGIMSVVKTAMGEGGRTLFSSFIDIERATYLHYGIPLAVMAVVLPALIKFFFKDKKQTQFIDMFLSVFSFLIGIQFLILGVVNSYSYIAICVIAGIISLGASCFFKGEIEFYKKEKAKERFFYILPVMLLWTVTVLIYEPNQILLNNLEEFSIPYFAFFRVMFLEGAALTAVYVLAGVFILSQRQLKAFGTIIFGLSAAGYIQGNFLNGEMLSMDGTVQIWSSTQKAVNAVVWLVILAAAVFINYSALCKKAGRRIVQIVCVYICLMQILSLAFVIITTEFPDEENEFMLTTNSMLELDKENNVVVFVLDWFDRQIMDEILEQTPDFTKNLSDFTDYTNATSCYAFTAMAVPYLLTGVEWEYKMDSADYCQYAYDNSTMLDEIEAQNYSIGLYTASSCVGDAAKQKLVNYSDEVEKRLGYKKAFYVMNNSSKYKMAPFAAKQIYFYTTEDIAEIVVSSGKYTINNDVVFHNIFSREKLSIDKNEGYNGAFRFYHLKGAHALYNMNENFEEVKENGTRLSQSRGSVKIVYEFIDEMKKLGIYDDATIIITADHGQNTHIMTSSEAEKEDDMTSTPILFVKLPHEKHEGGPIKNEAPVSQTEFAATLINAVGGDYEKYGKTFAQIQEGETRERTFIYYAPEKGRYKKCVINGDANKADSWTVVSEEE